MATPCPAIDGVLEVHERRSAYTCRFFYFVASSPNSRCVKAGVAHKVVVRRGRVASEIVEPFGGVALPHDVKTTPCCLHGVLEVGSILDIFILDLARLQRRRTSPRAPFNPRVRL